jgi:ATP-binding cassette, subfamily C (CFTR/MRP), member 1
MMDLDSGSIAIDGIDISTVPHEYVRSRITAVPQETYILNGTVRLNVDPTEAVSDEELVRVLQRVQLWSKIEQRGGLDTVIHEKFFSHGEAQLLVFARAMVRKSRVLILDEITSKYEPTLFPDV